MESSLILASPVEENEEVAALFDCLHEANARRVLFITAVHVGGFIDLASEPEIDCLWDMVAHLDPLMVLRAAQPGAEDHTPGGEFLSAMYGCGADVMVSRVAEDENVALDDDQAQCLREVLTGIDVQTATAMFVYATNRTPELEDPYAELDKQFEACAPQLYRHNYPDDHSSRLDAATPIEVGVPLVANIEYEADLDHFVFKATAGTLYRVSLEPSKDLKLGEVTLHLRTNDPDQAIASGFERLDDENVLVNVYLAYKTGPYFVSVSSWDIGQYTLIVETAEFFEIGDDHGNSREDATPLDAPGSLPGQFDHAGDIDYFVFYAEEGVHYEIENVEEFVPGFWLKLSDQDSLVQAGPQIRWVAPASGPYWIVAEGYWGSVDNKSNYILEIREAK